MTGYIELNEQYYTFTFNDYKLTLHNDFKNIYNYTPIDKTNMCIDSSAQYLIGYSTDTCNCIIFYLKQSPPNDLDFWTTSTLGVSSWIEYKRDVAPVSSMSFYCKEIDYFYGLNQGYQLRIKNEGESSVHINSFNDCKEDFTFNLNSELINATIGIQPVFHTKSNTPVTLNSYISFSFEPTYSINKILDLYYTLLHFLQFVCYRKNINFDFIELYTNTEHHKPLCIGYFNYKNIVQGEENDKVLNKTVSYNLIKPCISSLFNKITTKTLYINHIPNSTLDANLITPARFVLITAAFEWNVRGIYTFSLSEKQISVQQDILEAIASLPKTKNYNSNLRKKFTSTYKHLSNMNPTLSDKIKKVLEDLEPVLDIFIKNLYKINDKNMDNYSIIGERFQRQRNNYAHGNIDKDLKPNTILDVILLEWVNYAVVFKELGYTTMQNQKLINAIFRRNFYIPDSHD